MAYCTAFSADAAMQLQVKTLFQDVLRAALMFTMDSLSYYLHNTNADLQ